MPITTTQVWKISNGQTFDTKEKAEKEEGRYQLEQLVSEAISSYDYVIDVDQLLARKQELIEALHEASK